MIKLLIRYQRPQSVGEEIANSISHGLGVLGAMVTTPVLISAAIQRGDTTGTIGASIFATTTFLLYLTSTIYHVLPRSRAKQIFQILDHVAIFLMIAGTYTPFTLGILRGTLGWIMLGLVWSLALLGIMLKCIYGVQNSWFSTLVYVIMGWLVIIVIKPLWFHMSTWGLFWLLAGGIAYTGGVFFFATDQRFHYNHFIWHLFVMVGTSCHFIAVLWYSA